MSVRIISSAPLHINHIAIPLTGAVIGTPPAIKAKVEPHTDAIEVDPHDPSTSLTILSV